MLADLTTFTVVTRILSLIMLTNRTSPTIPALVLSLAMGTSVPLFGFLVAFSTTSTSLEFLRDTGIG